MSSNSNGEQSRVEVVESIPYGRGRQVLTAAAELLRVVDTYYPQLPQYTANTVTSPDPVNPAETAVGGMNRVDQLMQDLYRP